MKFLILILLICYVPLKTWSQTTTSSNSGLQYRFDLQYIQLNYEEPGVMTEKGQFTGFQGQLYGWLSPEYGISSGDRYYSGNLNYDGSTFGGTPIRVITKDYVSEYFLLAHARYTSLEVSLGYAHRTWFNDLVISYTRKTKYNYYPLAITYSSAPFYYKAEYRIWGEGKNISTMSRVNSASRDVTFTQDSGTGFLLEVGVHFPYGPLQVKTYLAYDSWDVADSDIQNDNTQDLLEPENNTKTYIFGVGFIY